LTYNDQRFSTQTIYKTLAPVWNAVFDVAINPGLGSGVLEAVLWDRDRFKKDYLGEFSINLTDLFPNGALTLDDPTNEVPSLQFI
jgi:phosphatidylserine decarboxylase